MDVNMLTPKQKQILDYIKKYIKEKDYAPSLEDMRRRFKLSSRSTIHQHVETLREKGYLSKIENQPRSIELNNRKRESGLIDVPLLGTIAAGEPIEAIENKEIVEVQKKLLSKSGEHFALRVQGNSMINEGIFDGDTVIIRKQPTVENGETAVALINDNEVTLKKIYKEKTGFRLQPANPNLKPIFTKEITIQGKVVSIIRNFKNLKERTEQIDNSKLPRYKAPKNIVDSRNRLNDLSAQEWLPETISVFVQKGLGANHPDTKIEKQHPAPFSYQDVGRLIRFFTKKDQLVLDPFCGVGSTLKACALNNRRGIGIELVKKYADLTKQRLATEIQTTLFGNKRQEIIHGDALEVIKKQEIFSSG